MQTNYGSVLELITDGSILLQYLSGAIICRKYVREKSTGDSSGFLFISGFQSCCLWIRYGYLTLEHRVVMANKIGAILFLIYSLIYFHYTVEKPLHFKQFIFVMLIYYVFHRIPDYPVHEIDIMRTICCIVTVFFIAEPFSRWMQVLQNRNTECLPFPVIVTTFFASVLWLIRGIILGDILIQFPSFICLVLSLVQLSLFILYPSKEVFPNKTIVI